MKHHDESMALAALFDCWTPKWRKINGPYGFKADIRPALLAFGFEPKTASPFYLVRYPSFIHCHPGEPFDEGACLLTTQELRSPSFLSLFRRRQPHKIILAAKSGLWWSVWTRATTANVTFHISTAEYIPRGK